MGHPDLDVGHPSHVSNRCFAIKLRQFPCDAIFLTKAWVRIQLGWAFLLRARRSRKFSPKVVPTVALPAQVRSRHDRSFRFLPAFEFLDRDLHNDDSQLPAHRRSRTLVASPRALQAVSSKNTEPFSRYLPSPPDQEQQPAVLRTTDNTHLQHRNHPTRNSVLECSEVWCPWCQFTLADSGSVFGVVVQYRRRAHLSDDGTVAKMEHPDLDVGHGPCDFFHLSGTSILYSAFGSSIGKLLSSPLREDARPTSPP